MQDMTDLNIISQTLPYKEEEDHTSEKRKGDILFRQLSSFRSTYFRLDLD